MGLISPPSVGDVGSSSFTQKLIQCGIELAQGTGTQPGNLTGMPGGTQISLSGSRTSVKIQYAGGFAGSKAEVVIWGLSQSLMNTLQTLGITVQQVKRNRLVVTAGDAVSGMSTAFIGDIVAAYGDYNSQPNVPIRFVCQAGAADAAIPVPTSSFTGAADIITIMSSIAKLASWGFVNNGITPGQIVLSNPIFPGSAVEQARRAADHANISYALVPGSSTTQAYILAIWPRYGSRPTPGGIPLISKSTGMIGYPAYAEQGGINVKMLYNPQIVFGGQINVQSDIFTNQSLAALKTPNSIWDIAKVDHSLDSLVPHGEWQTLVYAVVYNASQPTLPPGSP